MTSKEIKKFRRAKRKIKRRKNPQALLKMVVTRLIYISLLKNVLNKVINYLTIAYFCALLRFKTGNKDSTKYIKITIKQQQELSRVIKDLKAAQDFITQQRVTIKQLENDVINWVKRKDEIENEVLNFLIK